MEWVGFKYNNVADDRHKGRAVLEKEWTIRFCKLLRIWLAWELLASQEILWPMALVRWWMGCLVGLVVPSISNWARPETSAIRGWNSGIPEAVLKMLGLENSPFRGEHTDSYFVFVSDIPCRSQWPRGLRRGCTAARQLRSLVRIPPGAWMFACCECCVLSGRGLCDELITRP